MIARFFFVCLFDQLTETRNAILANYQPLLEYIASLRVYLKWMQNNVSHSPRKNPLDLWRSFSGGFKSSMWMEVHRMIRIIVAVATHTCRIHSTRYIDCVPPNIILRLSCTNDSSYHRSDVDAFNKKFKFSYHNNRTTYDYRTYEAIDSPIRIMKLLYEFSLMFCIDSLNAFAYSINAVMWRLVEWLSLGFILKSFGNKKNTNKINQ